MSRKTFGAGALATAATLAFTVVAAEDSGAAAQQDDLSAPIAGATGEPESQIQPAIRFVAREIVQALPDETRELPEIADPEAGAPTAPSLPELVRSIPANGQISDELHCLAQAVYFEARGEPLTGQLAVARVIVNRAESHLFPDSYCSVVKQRSQFSFVRNGYIPAVRQNSPAWHRAMAIATIADEGLWESQAGEALYFHARHVKPRWASNKLALATIDSHVFYR